MSPKIRSVPRFLPSLSRFARRNGPCRSSLSRPPEGHDCQPFVRGRPCLAGSPSSSSQRFTDRELAEEFEVGTELVCTRGLRSLACSLAVSISLSFPLSLGRQGRPQWRTILLPPLLSVDDSRSLPPGKAVHVRYPLDVGATMSNLQVSSSRGDPLLPSLFLFSPLVSPSHL